MTVPEPRLMSGTDVANYCGITLATLSKWVTEGRLPPPLPGTRRWDRKALDLALDKLSGIEAPLSKEDAAEREWQAWHAEYQAKLTAERANRPGQTIEDWRADRLAKRQARRKIARERWLKRSGEICEKTEEQLAADRARYKLNSERANERERAAKAKSRPPRKKP